MQLRRGAERRRVHCEPKEAGAVSDFLWGDPWLLGLALGVLGYRTHPALFLVGVLLVAVSW